MHEKTLGQNDLHVGHLDADTCMIPSLPQHSYAPHYEFQSMSFFHIWERVMTVVTFAGQRHFESYTQWTGLSGTLVNPGRLAPGTPELAVSRGSSAASKSWRYRHAMPW